jgi:hypothetical protein
VILAEAEPSSASSASVERTIIGNKLVFWYHQQLPAGA